MLQIAKPAVNLLGAPGTGAAGKIPFFHQDGLQATRRGVLSDSDARDPPADDKKIRGITLIDD